MEELMGVVNCSGEAVFQIEGDEADTPEQIKVKASSLDWEVVNIEERKMGAETTHQATYCVESKSGEVFEITWTLHEYPDGCFNARNTENPGLELIEDIKCDVQEIDDE
jgi:hypothetical protein